MRNLITLMMVVSMLLMVATPNALALDLTSYIQSSRASTDVREQRTRLELAETDEERMEAEAGLKKAKTRRGAWLGAGLLLDLVGILLMSSGSSADRVERLETEVANGGGPMVDAYAAGLGVSRKEVLASALLKNSG